MVVGNFIEMKIKLSLAEKKMTYSELRDYLNIGKKKGLCSEPTFAKYLRKLEQEGKITRRVFSGDYNVYYVLVDKKVLIAEYIAKNIFYEEIYTIFRDKINKMSEIAKILGFGKILLLGMIDDEQIRGYVNYIYDNLVLNFIRSQDVEGREEIKRELASKIESLEVLEADEIESEIEKMEEEFYKKFEEL
jgi:DNA-binding HxlR family transcriptional regulator